MKPLNDRDRAGYTPTLTITAVVLLLIVAGSYVRSVNHPTGQDLRIYLRAGQRLAGGESIYDDALALRGAVERDRWAVPSGPYCYPPTLAAMLSPLAGQPVGAVVLGFAALNVFLMAFCVWCTARFLPPEVARLWWPVIACVFLIYYPIHEDLVIGQTQVLLLSLMLGSLHLLRGKRQILAGIVLGLAIAIKLFPAVLVVFFLWQRKWIAAASACLTGGLVLGLAFAVAGPRSLSDFIAILPVWTSGPLSTFPLKQSLGNFWSRLFVASCFNVPLVESAVLLKVLSLLSAVTLLWLTLRQIPRGSSNGKSSPSPLDHVALPLAYAVILTGYTPWLVVPASLLICESANRRRLPLAVAAAVLAVAFSQMEVSLWAFRNLAWLPGGLRIVAKPAGLALLGQSPYLYQALLTWGMLMYLHGKYWLGREEC